MTDLELQQLKYPIGTFKCPKTIDDEKIKSWINTIASFPERIRELGQDLTDEQKEWQYRPGSWNIRQLVHHCADSHLNSIIRFKLALTEDTPSIKPYYEDRWAELADYDEKDLSSSLMLISSLHHRWTLLLKSLGEKELKKTYYHPEHRREIHLEETIGMYAWHSEHHLAHIKQALKFHGRFHDNMS
ncbi:putative metal-dependent hydrolase [Echinicola marina]|uniref:YfiT family bacillithiol transferase n=1 Tax=Echinicola marina TaxID=2859768 RepID=UPI001CF62FE8|nr:putative metal-dependent hydrolase [Echinicola marina]UCS94641.1 putative metal-dependent hydrolase [Echinicola marina]